MDVTLSLVFVTLACCVFSQEDGVPFTGRLNIDQGELGGSRSDLQEVLLASMQNTISLTELVTHQSEKISELTGTLNGMRQELNEMQEHLDQIGSGTRTDIGAIRNELDVTLASLNSNLQTQAEDLREEVDVTLASLNSTLQTQAEDLREGVDVTLASLNSTLQSTAEELREEVATEISRIDEVEEEARRGKWPEGAFCFLANGACPAGFNTISGYMKAVSLYAGTEAYIKSATFGSSKIKCHGGCGQYGHWTGELYLVTCCK